MPSSNPRLLAASFLISLALPALAHAGGVLQPAGDLTLLLDLFEPAQLEALDRDPWVRDSISLLANRVYRDLAEVTARFNASPRSRRDFLRGEKGRPFRAGIARGRGVLAYFRARLGLRVDLPRIHDASRARVLLRFGGAGEDDRQVVRFDPVPLGVTLRLRTYEAFRQANTRARLNSPSLREYQDTIVGWVIEDATQELALRAAGREAPELVAALRPGADADVQRMIEDPLVAADDPLAWFTRDLILTLVARASGNDSLMLDDGRRPLDWGLLRYVLSAPRP